MLLLLLTSEHIQEWNIAVTNSVVSILLHLLPLYGLPMYYSSLDLGIFIDNVHGDQDLYLCIFIDNVHGDQNPFLCIFRYIYYRNITVL